MPCPACGSTKAAVSIIHGDFLEALYLNPLAYIILFLMVIIPSWIIYDWSSNKTSFLQFYCKTEIKLKQKSIAYPAIILVLMNWIWNVYKT
ncbi:MAG: DUF2752 domain-containing protein [Bacteroidetes bacterium]|nr:DUF2752 domain-containing protein [Bacteroidota bacterium]